MNLSIYLIGVKEAPFLRISGMDPGFFEGQEPGAAAFRTRPVAGGERYGLIQKEQLGVAARRHDGTVPPFEFEYARDPTPADVAANDLPVRVVQRPATVAHECAAGGRPKNFAGGRYAVLERHEKAPAAEMIAC
jgi:hypothetical protein